MFQAELHLQQDKPCALTDFAEHFDVAFEVYVEELHDSLVTFILEIDTLRESHLEFFEAADQVRHVERLDDQHLLITKRSCGAYTAIDENHGVLRRESSISTSRRVYTVLFFRREDLKRMIDAFGDIGTVTLGKVSRFDEPTARLTARQLEVVTCALEEGYFEWPRRISSEELAEKIGVNRTTALEHLRKAQAKLLADALEGASYSGESRTGTLTTRPPERP